MEQELLKGVYERKKELLDTKRWEITEKQSVTQPSFICNNLFEGKITNKLLIDKLTVQKSSLTDAASKGVFFSIGGTVANLEVKEVTFN